MVNIKRSAIYLLYAIIACQVCFTVEQNVDLEQECNILKTLDALAIKIEKMEALASKIEKVDAIATKVEKMEVLASKVDILEKQIKDTTRNSVGTYTRWGRTSCPGNGSELVYSGLVGGSSFADKGAAVDYLCLPNDPIYAHYDDTEQGGGHVYGAYYMIGYERDTFEYFPEIDNSTSLFDIQVPCAVCATTRQSVMMVPARNICHDSWTLEYKGYLSSGNTYDAAASQYICLDDQPEYVPGEGSYFDYGRILRLVERRCGYTDCTPYVNGRELTCAVCSR